jgi:hypothetical protein
MTFWSKMLRRVCAIATSGALVLSGFPALAQQPPAEPPPAQPLGQAQLEELLAPIALYPDALVAQILTASTYPLEVVEAERWVSANPNVQGDPLQDAMQQQSWDASVKGLTAVPQVLAMMNDKLDWTQQVGEAFLAQPNDVTNAIQQLRAKAAANGNLKSSQQLKVTRVAAPPPPPLPGPPPGADLAMLPPPPPPDYYEIEPADPGMYYVPIYDPTLVYGPWAWPAYTPFYWYPPGYVVGAAVLGFGVGFVVGAALWAHYDWRGGRVAIDVGRYNQFNRTHLVATGGGFSSWQFNAAHRGSVGFHNVALRQQFGGPAARGTFQGGLPENRSLNVNRGPAGPANAAVNRNANLNGNAGANRNVDVNRNVNVNRNVDVNRNVNVNRTVNVNRNVTVNRTVNVARPVVNRPAPHPAPAANVKHH